jgi:hypothetical protein
MCIPENGHIRSGKPSINMIKAKKINKRKIVRRENGKNKKRRVDRMSDAGVMNNCEGEEIQALFPKPPITNNCEHLDLLVKKDVETGFDDTGSRSSNTLMRVPNESPLSLPQYVHKDQDKSIVMNIGSVQITIKSHVD